MQDLRDAKRNVQIDVKDDQRTLEIYYTLGTDLSDGLQRKVGPWSRVHQSSAGKGTDVLRTPPWRQVSLGRCRFRNGRKMERGSSPVCGKLGRNEDPWSSTRSVPFWDSGVETTVSSYDCRLDPSIVCQFVVDSPCDVVCPRRGGRERLKMINFGIISIRRFWRKVVIMIVSDSHANSYVSSMVSVQESITIKWSKWRWVVLNNFYWKRQELKYDRSSSVRQLTGTLTDRCKTTLMIESVILCRFKKELG